MGALSTGTVAAAVAAARATGGWFGGWGTHRTTESVLKDEDPQYLQVIEYTKKIEDQILGFRAAAKLYVKQLQNRVNSTQLHELGAAAAAMGECEATWAGPSPRPLYVHTHTHACTRAHTLTRLHTRSWRLW